MCGRHRAPEQATLPCPSFNSQLPTHPPAATIATRTLNTLLIDMDSDDKNRVVDNGAYRDTHPTRVPLPSSPVKAAGVSTPPDSPLLEGLASSSKIKEVLEPRTAIFLQEKCFLHRFIRSRDSAIVERPERLRAVALGLSVALARLEDESSKKFDHADLLARAMSKLDLSSSSPTTQLCRVVHSEASVDITSHPATRFIHALDDSNLVEGVDYLQRVRKWALESEAMVAKGESEIPNGLAQGDLYRA